MPHGWEPRRDILTNSKDSLVESAHLLLEPSLLPSCCTSAGISYSSRSSGKGTLVEGRVTRSQLAVFGLLRLQARPCVPSGFPLPKAGNVFASYLLEASATRELLKDPYLVGKRAFRVVSVWKSRSANSFSPRRSGTF